MESKEAVKERMKRYRDRKKLEALKADPGMTAMGPAETKHVDPPTHYRNGCEAVRILEDAVRDLLSRVQEIERQLSPDEVSRRQALKPGAHPTELYGA